MATLSAPGVSVQVVDESFYASAAPGTTPLIIIATAENKLNGAGTGAAPGTLGVNNGNVYLVTSQKDLVDTFGDPIFQTDANNNPIHAGEQNEYGLQAAYSFLGVSNRAFVARADIDLNQLTASVEPPTDLPANGTYWFDIDNSFYGIFEWNGAPITTTGGQSFVNKLPIMVDDPTHVVNFTGNDLTPKNSVGSIGDYAIVTLDTANNLFFKNKAGNWVIVGSNAWSKSWPTVAGTTAALNVTLNDTFYLNETLITAGTTLQSIVDAISTANIPGISAAIVNNKLELYNDGNDNINNAITGSIRIDIGTIGTLVAPTVADSVLGIAVGTYYNPKLTISKHTNIPEYKRKNPQPRPTGSVWIKSTQANLGARWRIKRFNAHAKTWEILDSGLHANAQSAINAMDKIGGGINIPRSEVYINYNYTEDYGSDDTPLIADFKPMIRTATGATTIKSKKIETNSLLVGTKSFSIAESVIGSSVLGDYDNTGAYRSSIITFETDGITNDADSMASAINAAGLINVRAGVDSLNRVTISHKLGGEIRMKDGNGEPLVHFGFSEYNPDTKTGTQNLYLAPVGDTLHDLMASLWMPLKYTAGTIAPTSITPDGMAWYSSVLDEIDIMVHDGNHWVGYHFPTSPYYSVDDATKTDPMGPIIAASTPDTQSDGTMLVTGDIWVDTSDIENFPMIYRFNADFENKPIKNRWVLVDKTDQSTEEGVLFFDARYNTAGDNSDVPGTIVDLLSSDFVDFDAPDPALYPKGMLLWNLRRSGFNVKKYVHNYINPSDSNPRYGAAPLYSGDPMEFYYVNRWVTISNNEIDGSGTFGRKAQRKVVVQHLQALVNSNQHIRDEESRVFNLIACPGYPELIGEMISLNYDRGLTSFIVGDTPARLSSNATSLLEWGTNAKLAVEDNDLGAASFDEYLGLFYPWGYTSDNYGNNVAVPPSHMLLRTIALNDQVAYPWFAPAGLRRGGITNATAVGYVDKEGEFRSVSLNNGQRDTLYDAKINPITFFATSGLVNFGQKTRARTVSSMDRINVVRLVIYLRRRLALLAKPFIFEPNDKITRDELKGVVEGMMIELVSQRAINDYLVVCDTSNNTPTRVDKNELYLDIAIVPTRTVEFIYIPLRLKNTSGSTA